MASAYRLGGYGGISALATAALIALHAVVFANASRFVCRLPALGAIVTMDIILIPMMLARPHLLAWAVLALWTFLMLRARQQDRAPPLVAALVMVVWVNLHGSFVLGLVVAAAIALEAVGNPTTEFAPCGNGDCSAWSPRLPFSSMPMAWRASSIPSGSPTSPCCRSLTSGNLPAPQ